MLAVSPYTYTKLVVFLSCIAISISEECYVESFMKADVGHYVGRSYIQCPGCCCGTELNQYCCGPGENTPTCVSGSSEVSTVIGDISEMNMAEIICRDVGNRKGYFECAEGCCDNEGRQTTQDCRLWSYDDSKEFADRWSAFLDRCPLSKPFCCDGRHGVELYRDCCDTMPSSVIMSTSTLFPVIVNRGSLSRAVSTVIDTGIVQTRYGRLSLSTEELHIIIGVGVGLLITILLGVVSCCVCCTCCPCYQCGCCSSPEAPVALPMAAVAVQQPVVAVQQPAVVGMQQQYY